MTDAQTAAHVAAVIDHEATGGWLKDRCRHLAVAHASATVAPHLADGQAQCLDCGKIGTPEALAAERRDRPE